MLKANEATLYSGGAAGTEAEFGTRAESCGLQQVNYSFEGHQPMHTKGLRILTNEELALKDVSLTYVSKLMHRQFTSAPLFRKVLQSICWQVSSGHEIFVVGDILEDGTVKGGTGWGAEFAKICNKPLFVFDQKKNAWFAWNKDNWEKADQPRITERSFTATGTRFLEDNGRKAIADLFARSFS